MIQDCRLRSNYEEGEIGISLTGLFLNLSQAGTWISNTMYLFVFNDLRREVVVSFVFNDLRREVVVSFVFNDLRREVVVSFVFNDLRREVVVSFVNIHLIVDHHCLTFPIIYHRGYGYQGSRSCERY